MDNTEQIVTEEVESILNIIKSEAPTSDKEETLLKQAICLGIITGFILLNKDLTQEEIRKATLKISNANK